MLLIDQWTLQVTFEAMSPSYLIISAFHDVKVGISLGCAIFGPLLDCSN